jgi:hypothetical protein
MKITAFWDIASAPARLHGAVSQKALILILKIADSTTGQCIRQRVQVSPRAGCSCASLIWEEGPDEIFLYANKHGLGILGKIMKG